jgi:hypothetical protein
MPFSNASFLIVLIDLNWFLNSSAQRTYLIVLIK